MSIFLENDVNLLLEDLSTWDRVGTEWAFAQLNVGPRYKAGQTHRPKADPVTGWPGSHGERDRVRTLSLRIFSAYSLGEHTF